MRLLLDLVQPLFKLNAEGNAGPISNASEADWRRYSVRTGSPGSWGSLSLYGPGTGTMNIFAVPIRTLRRHEVCVEKLFIKDWVRRREWDKAVRGLPFVRIFAMRCHSFPHGKPQVSMDECKRIPGRFPGKVRTPHGGYRQQLAYSVRFPALTKPKKINSH